jgi:hypothetical protein
MRFKLIIVFILFSIVSFSQEEKLKFHSISFSPINIYADNHTSGLTFSLDVSLKKGKHIYKLFGQTGSDVDLFSRIDEKFSEIDILYGREVKAKKWLYYDFYGGLGYFSHKTSPGAESSGFFSYSKYSHQKNNTIGILLQSMIRFKTSKRFSLGFQLHTNINSVNTIYSTGVFFQWKLVKESRLE